MNFYLRQPVNPFPVKKEIISEMLNTVKQNCTFGKMKESVDYKLLFNEICAFGIDAVDAL